MNGFKKYFIDSNIFLRVLVPENRTSFLECSAVLRRMSEGAISVVIDTLVFAEVSWVLGRLYKFPKHEIVTALNSMIQAKHLIIDDRHDVARGLFLYARHNVKFIDAMIGAHDLIALDGVPIVSYDKDFDKLGIKRLEPKDVI